MLVFLLPAHNLVGVMMPLIVGLDRSGTPDPRERKASQELYVVCFAAVEVTLEELRVGFNALRQECGMGYDQEFHGRSCPEWVQGRLLETAQRMNLRVAASIYEKVSATQGQPLPGTAADFQAESALTLFANFVRQHQISGLWCDEDIEGKERRKAFETAASRIHRLAWPNTRLKVRHKSSKNSDLIQLADIVAYGLSRLLRERVEDNALKKKLKGLRDDPRNIVTGPMLWEV